IITLIDVLKNLCSLAAIGSALIIIDWYLLPLLVLFILPTFFVRIYYADKQNTLRMQHTPTERKAGYLSSLITSDVPAKEIRSYGLGDYLKNQYLDIRMKLVSERLRISFNRSKSETLTTAISSLG